jgi:hypothetical protein
MLGGVEKNVYDCIWCCWERICLGVSGYSRSIGGWVICMVLGYRILSSNAVRIQNFLSLGSSPLSIISFPYILSLMLFLHMPIFCATLW